MMKLYINGIEYKFGSDYEISEQASATAVMEMEILLEGKAVPEPFDSVSVVEELKSISSDVSLGFHRQTETISSVLQLSADPELEDTWNMWNGLIWADVV